MKKMIAFLCALALMAGCTSCAEKSGKSAVSVSSAEQTMYKESSIDLPADYVYANCIFPTADGLMLVYNDTDEHIRSVRYDAELNMGGSFVIEKGEGEWLSFFSETDDGNLRAFSSVSTDKEKAVAIKTFSADGKLVSAVDLGDLGGRLDMNNIFANAVTFHGDETLLSLDKDAILVGGDGQVKASVPLDMSESYTFDSEGGIICSNMNRHARLDKLKTPTESELRENPNGSSMQRPPVTGDGRYAAYLHLDDGIYGMSAAGDMTLLVDFIASQVSGAHISAFCPLGEGRFAVLSTGLTLLTARPDDYVEERGTVLMGVHGNADQILRNTAVEFAKENDGYTVEFREYDTQTDDLKRDILAGDSPDVYIPTCHNEMIKYINLGAVADFAELHEKYGGISEEDFLPNVVNGLKHKGKLYSMAESYTPDIHMVNSEVLPRGQEGWDYGEFMDFVEALPDDMYLSEHHFLDNSVLAFDWLCQNNFSDWVDYEKAECCFDSPEFIRLLEFCKNANYIGEYGQGYWENTTEEERTLDAQEDLTLLGRKKALMGYRMPSGCRLWDIIGDAAAHSMSLDDITLVMQPNSSRHGSFRIDRAEYFVLKTGNCEQGGWEFLNYVLSYNNQMNDTWGLCHTRKDAFEDAWSNTFKEYENSDREVSGGLNNYRYTYTLTISRENFDYVKETVLACDKLGQWDWDISPILSEEFEQYIAGESTAEQCAEHIQNRVSLFLSEQE